MKFLKAIGKFFKNKKVHVWAAIMACVIVLAFCMMSWIMVSDKVVYGKTGNQTVIRENNEFVKVAAEKFDFVPALFMVDTITVSSGNDDLSNDTVQLNNNMIGGELDPVVLKNEAKAVEAIIKRLDSGRKTNSFIQFFTGGASGEQRVTQTYTGTFQFQEISEEIWIKIVFATPQFVVNQASQGQPWEIQKFVPGYSRPIDKETGQAYGTSANIYNTRIINAIHIPLGNVKNKFERQTWYLSTGNDRMNNTTSMGFTFTTYGNYHSLLRYISKIDDEFLL